MPLVKICDIEVTVNTFLYSDVDINTDEIITFVIHESLNQGQQYYDYSRKLDYQIGFNNLHFDSQVQQYFIENWEWLQFLPPSDIANHIYNFAQKIIAKQDSFDKFSLEFPEHKLTVRQLDLYKIHHFDNIAKKQSLKGLQCTLNYYNVQEMPFSHTEYLTDEQVKILIEYNKNDILSTKLLFQKSSEQIELRKHLRKLYDINCLNWSDSKIGEELVLKFYCDYIKADRREVKSGRTKREVINLKDCVLPTISFKTNEFNRLLKRLSDVIIYNGDTKKQEKIIARYKGLEIDYGNGGVHASLQGVFEETEDEMIYDIDVKSLYPSIAIANGFYPEHLGPEFCQVYKEKIIDLRFTEQAKPKEQRNESIILALKNAANSVYGKSNSRFSFLYDPRYTLNTTVTGQLQLSMLAEEIGENLDCTIIQMNTDGITVKIKKSDENKFLDICKNWENQTRLILEYVTYKKMYIRDVNNYCAIKDYISAKDPKNSKDPKLKGCFESDYSKPANFHKDCSFRIIPLALEKYIVEGIPIKETIAKHDKIWDFLGRVKFKKNMHGVLTSVKNGKIVEIETQKDTRYFVSNRGYTFRKVFHEGTIISKSDGTTINLSEIKRSNIDEIGSIVKERASALEKGFKVTEANIITDENAMNYDINRRYYELECYKIIDAVESRWSKINGKKKKIGNKDQLTLL